MGRWTQSLSRGGEFGQGWPGVHRSGCANLGPTDQIQVGTQLPASPAPGVRYTVLTGTPPFTGAPLSEMYQNIRDGHYPEPAHLSPNARRLIARLLAPDPAERPSLDHLLQDDFFTQVCAVPQRGPPGVGGGVGVGGEAREPGGPHGPPAPRSLGLHSGPAASPLLPQRTPLHRAPASGPALPEGGPPAADPVPAAP